MPSLLETAWPTGGAIPAGSDVAPSFRHYVESRKYDYGRGTAAAWNFIAFARGDPTFPDLGSWSELKDYLESRRAGNERLQAARSVWRSFTAYRSRIRQRTRGESWIVIPCP